MRGQIFLEFLIAFLAMIIIVQFLVQSQASSLARSDSLLGQTKTKMELEKIASLCNLLYFNSKNAQFNFTFNLQNFRIIKNTIVSESGGRDIASECFGEMSGSSIVSVEGVKRWF